MVSHQLSPFYLTVIPARLLPAHTICSSQQAGHPLASRFSSHQILAKARPRAWNIPVPSIKFLLISSKPCSVLISPWSFPLFSEYELNICPLARELVCSFCWCCYRNHFIWHNYLGGTKITKANQKLCLGNSLVVQWLGLHIFTARAWV